MKAIGPTTRSRKPSGRSPATVAQNDTREQRSNKVSSVVADPASAPIAASATSEIASTLLFSPAVAHATGVEDGISGSAAAPGDIPFAIDASGTPGVSGAAVLPLAAAVSGAPRPSPGALLALRRQGR